MQTFELDYANMIAEIYLDGNNRATRNGITRSLFGMSLELEMPDGCFPLIQGRKMYPKGILGELAAMLRGPKHVNDFKKWGCNYWDLWANEDGSLKVDYGNAWLDFNGVNQLEQLKDKLLNNPTDRRMIVSGWRPDRLDSLSLPCCHYSYQFYVQDNKLSMIWTQRSVDMMIGLPSDIVFAYAWMLAIGNEFGLKPGKLKMDFGDCHIYEEHLIDARKYLDNVTTLHFQAVLYEYLGLPGTDFCLFQPDFVNLGPYKHCDAIKFELKG